MYIETPDITVARYVFTNPTGNRVYYDGATHWVVDQETGIIDHYVLKSTTPR